MEWRCVVGCAGAGGPIMMELLKELGCEVVGINLEQTGRFAHPPEPIPEHLARPTLIPPRRLLQSLFCATG